jgi:hypothetical protein
VVQTEVVDDVMKIPFLFIMKNKARDKYNTYI